MQYCRKCVYPEVAVNVIFDDEGVCSACRVAEEFSRSCEKSDSHAWLREIIFRDYPRAFSDGVPHSGQTPDLFPVRL